MVIKLHKFGEMLISRPAGREAYFAAKAYLLKEKFETIEFDFEKVKVLTPSWMDEFIILLKTGYPKVKIKFLKSDNPSVQSTLKIISTLGIILLNFF
jgi:hypothetical protein